MSSVVTTVAVGAVGAAAKKLLTELFDYAKRELGSDHRLAQKALSGAELGKRIYAVINVKTLWNVEREVSLFEFYYPCRILLPGSSDPISPTVPSSLCGNGNLVIEGTAGQGKSIFLRFLYGQQAFSVEKLKVLPVFIELRRLRDEKPLEALIGDALERLGLPVGKPSVSAYLRTGRVILMLDGFDEVDQNLTDRLTYDLEHLVLTFPELRLIVSSRPGAAIQRSAHFRVAKLDPLRREDHLPFLEKVCASKIQASEINSTILQSASSLADLLATPLLLTLLVILYRAQSTLPSTISRFYEELFDVMFFRHDQTKPGFRRVRFTNLDEAKLKQLFESFAFQTQLRGTQVLTPGKFQECFSAALQFADIETTASGFQKELTRTACLLIEEGKDVSFIHKSVAEYYAAAFVQKSSEDFAKRFYAEVRTKHFAPWRGELSFLSEIDPHRHTRYFQIPVLEEFLGQFLPDSEASKEEKKSQYTRDFLSELRFNFSKSKIVDKTSEVRWSGISIGDKTSGPLQEILVVKLMGGVVDFIPRILPFAKTEIGSGDVIELCLDSLPPELSSALILSTADKLSQAIDYLEVEIVNARTRLDRENAKESLIAELSKTSS